VFKQVPSCLRKFNRFLPALLILGLIIYGFSPKSGGIEINIDDDSMTINGPGSNVVYRVEYSDIVSMALVDSFERGKCVSGAGTKTYSFGTWTNDRFGDYSLCVQNNIRRCIIVESPCGVTVFNFESNNATNSFYTAAMKILESRAAAGKSL
jgi:hypothetical protein